MATVTKIERSVVVAADRDRVWKALTTPEQIKKWWGTEFEFDRVAVGEPMRMIHEGKLIAVCHMTVVEPPTRFAFNWPLEPGYDAQTLVTFLLDSVDGGTRITVTEEGFDVDQVPAELRQRRIDLNSKGWTMVVEGLDKYFREATHA